MGDSKQKRSTKMLFKRTRIIEIAARLFEHDGYDGVSMGRLALALKSPKASLYCYFASKERLAIAVVETAHHAMAAYFKEINVTYDGLHRLRIFHRHFIHRYFYNHFGFVPCAFLLGIDHNNALQKIAKSYFTHLIQCGINIFSYDDKALAQKWSFRFLHMILGGFLMGKIGIWDHVELMNNVSDLWLNSLMEVAGLGNKVNAV